MAGFGWGSRQGGNMHARSQRPHASTQIACRICDQVFMSTHALINHTESHLIQEEAAAARRQQEYNHITSQRDFLFANNHLFQPNFSLLSQQTNPFLCSDNRYNNNNNNIVGGRPITQQLPLLPRDNFRHQSLPPPPQVSMREPPHTDDRTKPFLLQLERNMALRDHISQLQPKSDHNNKSDDSDVLDLTLKL